MAMIRCNECGHDISDQTETCPVCGLKTPGQPEKAAGMPKWAIWLLAAAFTAAMISECNKPPEPAKKPADNTEATLRGLCMMHIKQSLHDPSSAEFEHSTSTSVIKNGDTWIVLRPVRAKNAFNATRRAIFECRYTQSGSSYKLIGLNQLTE